MSGSSSAAAPRGGATGGAERTGGYGRGARVLSIGIAATGIFTFAYFAVASHVVGEVAAKQLDVLWSVMFIVISVIYRPIEQLLSRTLARRRALGHSRHPVRTPLVLQATFAAIFLVCALALRDPIQNELFDGSATLYWVLVTGTLFYAASYFARGWLAGHQMFGLYGGLVLMESTSRFLFPLAVAVGLASGEDVVAIGIAAAPMVSLVVVPLAFARHGEEIIDVDAEEIAEGVTVRESTGFAIARRRDHARRADAAQRRRPDDRDHRLRRRAGRDRLQRLHDHAGAAAALPGRADVAAAAPLGPGGDRRPRGLRARRPPDRCSSSPPSPGRWRSACWPSARSS